MSNLRKRKKDRFVVEVKPFFKEILCTVTKLINYYLIALILGSSIT